MTLRIAIAASFLLGLASSAQAQQHHGPGTSPYAELAQRPVKSLSAEQIADLRAGRGMGFALPAELNGYPGPIHVLDLADKLGLAEPQRAQVRALHEAMKAEAIPLGERLIALEAELERLFAGRTVTPASLATTTDAIGATQTALRRAHLKYHLATADILAPAQARHYAELRGYARPGAQPHHNGSHP